MAIISTLIGGICGFIAFLGAIIFSDIGLLPAFGLYVLVGVCTAVTIIVISTTRRIFGGQDTARPSAMTYAPQRNSAQVSPR